LRPMLLDKNQLLRTIVFEAAGAFKRRLSTNLSIAAAGPFCSFAPKIAAVNVPQLMGHDQRRAWMSNDVRQHQRYYHNKWNA